MTELYKNRSKLTHILASFLNKEMMLVISNKGLMEWSVTITDVNEHGVIFENSDEI